MKRSKLTIGCLIASITIGVASLGLTTAWYAASNQLNIETIDISVSTDRNLKVSNSPDLDTFKEHTIDGTGENAPLQGKSEVDLNLFKPVTSMYSFEEEWHSKCDWYTDPNYDNFHWMTNKSDKPYFVNSYQDSDTFVSAERHTGSMRPIPPGVAVSGYYSQTLYLLANTDAYITLDPETCFFNGYTCFDEEGTPSKQALFDAIHEKNVEQSKKIKGDNNAETEASYMDNLCKALRISILDADEDTYKYTIIDPFKKETTHFVGVLNMSTDSYFDNYFLHYEDLDGDGGFDRVYKEVIYGDVDEDTRDNALYTTQAQLSPERTRYNENGDVISDTIDSYQASSFTAYTRPYTYHALVDKSLKQNKIIAAEEHSVALNKLGSEEDALMIPVKRNTPKRIVLSMYLEGWDLDCINNTMGATFNTALSFKIARER